jgi:hypothetical protein
LEQRDIASISDRSFRLLIILWLLASEDKEKAGNIPEVEDIAFRARMDKPSVINGLQELKEFLTDVDINSISARYQPDAPETEREAEKKTEVEGEATRILVASLPGLPAVEGTPAKTVLASKSKRNRQPPKPDHIQWVEERNPGWVGITNDDLDAWGLLFPDVIGQIDAQLAQAHNWILKRPTEWKRKNWTRYIENWLATEQRKAR